MVRRLTEEVQAALAAAEDAEATAGERVEMLMEVAMGLQLRPHAADELHAAIALYDRAIAICPAAEQLLRARVAARRATALQSLPEDGTEGLEQARAAYEAVAPVFRDQGKPEEIAEIEMNLGVVLQSLAGSGRARITDAIAAYQRALRVFDRARFPQEYAVLQSNLATAFLAIPFTDERARMREALAVQAFEEGLRVVNIVDHPTEYAMLQNNLGNALQYASTSHSLANNLRALDAYAEALRVRTRETTPLSYANTLANKANCLRNLPDDPEDPARGNHDNLRCARACYAEAFDLFSRHGDRAKARVAAEALSEIDRDILSLEPAETTDAIFNH